MDYSTNQTLKRNLEQIDLWQNDVFMFTDEALNMRASEPIDELRGKPIKYEDAYGREHTTLLFDFEGRLVYHDLEFYTVDMFKNQSRNAFKKYRGTRYTWQQTIELTAYQRALDTFGKDSFDVRKRWISITSGHGCHAKGTKVLMFNGNNKNVEDIKVGDKLMGDDNTPRDVLSLARGREQMYRIRYSDNSYSDVNLNHTLALVRTQTKGKNKAGELVRVKLCDYLKWSEEKKRVHTFYRRSIELPKKDLLIDPYLLGLWLGDGDKNSGRISNIDTEIKEYLRKIGVGKEYIDKRTGCWNATVIGMKPKLRKIEIRTISRAFRYRRKFR